MNIWLTSDTHFRHANCIHLFKRADGSRLRDFPGGVHEMDETMVDNWNAVVKPTDHVYHLGDVSMMRPRLIANILSRLNGHLRLVRGNHDIFKTKEYLEYFDEIYGSRKFDNFLMTHYPVHVDHLGGWCKANLHGHIHDRVVMLSECDPVWGPVREDPDPRYINLSVERWNYTPVALEELKMRVAV